MRHFFALPSLIFALSLTTARAQVTAAWTALFQGPQSDSLNYATRLAIDPAGDIVVAGASSSGILVLKYSPQGQLLWSATYRGVRPLGDYTEGLAIDAVGNIYVTGRAGTVHANEDLVVLKYSVNGQLLWDYHGGPGAGPVSVGRALHIDAAGNVNVTGTGSPVNSGLDVLTLKLDAQGQLLWSSFYSRTNGSGTDHGLSLAVDAAGNVFVVGPSASDSESSFYDAFLLKYSPGGQLLWAKRADDASREANSYDHVKLDATGAPIVSGWFRFGQPNTYVDVVARYDTDGQLIWSKTHPGNSEIYPGTRGLELDSAGNVIVVASELKTLKYSGNGDFLWADVRKGLGGDVAVDAADNVYALGTAGAFSGALQIGVYKYSPEGALQWTYVHGRSTNHPAYPGAIALDATGSIYVTGTEFTADYSSTDALTFKLAPTDAPSTPRVSIVATRPITAESGRNNAPPAIFTLLRDDVSNPLTVLYSVGGTARPASDYAELPGYAFFAAGQRSTTVPVRPVDDLERESRETVRVELVPMASYQRGTVQDATVYILDDDHRQRSLAETKP